VPAIPRRKHRVPCKQAGELKASNEKQLTKQSAKASSAGGSKAVTGADGVECTIGLGALSLSECVELELPCRHVYHQSFVRDLREFGVNDTCPVCRAPLPLGPKAKHDEAVRLVVDAFFSLGSVLHQRQYRAAIAVEPKHANALANLGNLLWDHRQDITAAEGMPLGRIARPGACQRTRPSLESCS
jgi:hypothetical protein